MPKNFMTQSDDKTRWILAYILFAVSEALAVGYSYKSIGHTDLGYFSFALIFVAVIPIFSARTTLSLYRKNPTIQTDATLFLDLSFRLWSLVIAAYTLFMFAVIVSGQKR